eukprot:gnl/Dysnectes_brevis/2690_a3261_684.p1 GENE.gnl/Dysnectes_brevis/2690_a3261_684~~gnl/Dysnectes_brevis/2690_a3261_684.p1  ORF type:complete len:633 (+),score=236.05 gnl/Dysnectes_brevis/2690_a3261_684:2-1900(+)
MATIINGSPNTARGYRTSIAVQHSDNGFYAFASKNRVIVQNTQDPTYRVVFDRHREPVTAISFDDRLGEYIASGDRSGRVIVWMFTHPDRIIEVDRECMSGAIRQISWGPESKRIAACGQSATGETLVVAFQRQTGANIGNFIGHDTGVLGIAFRPCRPFRIATAGEDTQVGFYRGPPFRMLSVHDEPHTRHVNAVAYAPDGSYFVTAGADKRIAFFEGKSGDLLTTHEKTHRMAILDAVFSPAGDRLLTVSMDRTVKVWPITVEGLGEPVTVRFGTKGVGRMVCGAAWGADRIFVVTLDGCLYRLAPASLPAEGELPIEEVEGVEMTFGHQSTPSGIAVAAEGLVSCSLNSTLEHALDGTSVKRISSDIPSSDLLCLHTVGDVTYGFTCEDSFTVQGGELQTLDITPESRWKSVQPCRNGVLLLESKTVVYQPLPAERGGGAPIPLFQGAVEAAAYCPERNLLALMRPAAHQSARGQLVLMQDGEEVSLPTTYHSHITHMQFSPQTTRLFTADHKNRCAIWSVEKLLSKQLDDDDDEPWPTASGLDYHHSPVLGSVWLTEGVVLSRGQDGQVIGWSATRPRVHLPTPLKHGQNCTGISLVGGEWPLFKVASTGEDCAMRVTELDVSILAPL